MSKGWPYWSMLMGPFQRM